MRHCAIGKTPIQVITDSGRLLWRKHHGKVCRPERQGERHGRDLDACRPGGYSSRPGPEATFRNLVGSIHGEAVEGKFLFDSASGDITLDKIRGNHQGGHRIRRCEGRRIEGASAATPGAAIAILPASRATKSRATWARATFSSSQSQPSACPPTPEAEMSGGGCRRESLTPTPEAGMWTLRLRIPNRLHQSRHRKRRRSLAPFTPGFLRGPGGPGERRFADGLQGCPADRQGS